jgi:hypothetical protein
LKNVAPGKKSRWQFKLKRGPIARRKSARQIRKKAPLQKRRAHHFVGWKEAGRAKKKKKEEEDEEVEEAKEDEKKD